MPEQDKRRFPRLSVNVEVEYVVSDSANPERYTTSSKNVSEGGICVIAVEKVAIDTIIDLRFLIPELGKFINAKGKIAWVREIVFQEHHACQMYEVGIEFMDIAPEDRSKIKNIACLFMFYSFLFIIAINTPSRMTGFNWFMFVFFCSLCKSRF